MYLCTHIHVHKNKYKMRTYLVVCIHVTYAHKYALIHAYIFTYIHTRLLHVCKRMLHASNNS